jgi:hypothetical protein
VGINHNVLPAGTKIAAAIEEATAILRPEGLQSKSKAPAWGQQDVAWWREPQVCVQTHHEFSLPAWYLPKPPHGGDTVVPWGGNPRN